MHTHKQAAEKVEYFKGPARDDVAVSGDYLYYAEDAIELASQLADTIGWWESQDERYREHRKRKDDRIVELALQVADLKDELADYRLSCRLYEQEQGDLKEERDQLVDENIELMRALDNAHGIIGAINQIAGVSR